MINRIRRTILSLMLPLTIAILGTLLITHNSWASVVPDTPTDWAQAESTTAFSSSAPIEQDPCLHCHITGEEKGMWTPLARWVVFLTMSGIFLFGTIQSISVWKNRSPWKSIGVRIWEWVDERYQIADPLSKFLNKPVPQWQRRWWYCLGGLTAFFFVVQAITGTMLAFYYEPTADAAYTSIQFIETQVRFGASIRAIHHWSANGMIVMVVAHMMRVFVNGAFRAPRELNWVSGVLLFVTTLGFGFTGYLLPWDQRAYWATTVGTEIAGGIPAIGELALVYLRAGWSITSLTLSRFYALHILVFPAVIVAMMAVHFIMVRRQGIHKPL